MFLLAASCNESLDVLESWIVVEDVVKKILIIEESAQSRNWFSQCLEAKGFHAVSAENGAVGIEQLQKQLPDLIVCGITRVGNFDGFGIMSAIRKNPTTAVIPFIFVSSRTSRDDIRKGMELGADDYLTKPCTLKELLRSIHTQLEKRATLQKWYASNNQPTISQATIAETANATALHSIFPASTQMAAVFRFIEDNYWQPITLCDIARSVGYSPAYLTNLVRQQTGKSAYRWLVERRMVQAICLLQKTEQTIGQIAENIGYQNVCHFSHYFRQFYGTSPQAWRDEHCCHVAAGQTHVNLHSVPTAGSPTEAMMHCRHEQNTKLYQDDSPTILRTTMFSALAKKHAV